MYESRQTFRNCDEAGRQYALDNLDVLDTKPEPEFEKLTGLVRSIFDVPFAAISLVDRRRQWFKSIKGLDVSETPREVAFCDHTIRKSECLVVSDATKDPRFMNNPLVTGEPFIRAYIGAPIITADGYAIGAICGIDTKPRDFSPEQEDILSTFAGLAMNELELRQIASEDMLTGLATRRAFVEEMKRHAKSDGLAALLYIDLDHFKRVNDRFGHATGDEVLKATAQAITHAAPSNAVIGRLGGEELAVVLPECGVEAASHVAETVRSAIERATVSNHPDLFFTGSIGVAVKSGPADPDAWIELADRSLYAAKNAGRNCVRVTAHADGCAAPSLRAAV